jgi:pimeloyl-ACP methyl ester carboxylesterase
LKKLIALFTLLLIACSLQAEPVSIQHQGVRLNANLKQSDNWSDGPVILMTHGTLAHNKMEIMATLQNLLGDLGVSSLAINLGLGIDNRGSAFYDCPTPHRHRHTDALDEIGAWADWLQQQGVKKIALLGHSRGGNQTAWFAADHDRASISHVVLIAPQTWSMEYAVKNYRERYNKDLQPLLDKANALIAGGKGDTLVSDLGFIYCENTSATANAIASYYSDSPKMDTPFLLKDIKKPLLLVAGTADTVVKDLHRTMPPLAQQLGFQLMVLEGADHSFRDLYADEIAERIVEFLQE